MKLFDIVHQLTAWNGKSLIGAEPQTRFARGTRTPGSPSLAPCRAPARATERRRNHTSSFASHRSYPRRPALAKSEPTVLSLQQAAQILINARPVNRRNTDLMLQQRAFQQLHDHLQQHNFSHRPATFQPLLTLIAGRVGHLAGAQQREQAMAVIEQSLKVSPQLTLTEALTTQLWKLDCALQLRALTAIEGFLQATADLPQSHVDILVELTDVMKMPQCRQRAYAMVERGLARLRNEPAMTGRIRYGLALAFCMDAGRLALQS